MEMEHTKHQTVQKDDCSVYMPVSVPVTYVSSIDRHVSSCSSQTHPNVDKKLFTADSVIGLKNPEKSFPLNNDVGVLKWRLQTTDESLIPLTSKSKYPLLS